MRLSRFLVVPVVVLLVLAGLAGVLTGALSSAARAGLTAAGPLSDGGASTLTPGALPSSTSSSSNAAAAPAALPEVLAVATAQRPLAASRVRRAVEAVDRSAVRGSVSGSVVDAASGKVLYARNATTAALPASTLKLVTAAVALSVLGPQHRFATRVVSGGPGRVVLVGGGDPYLLAAPSGRHPGAATVARLAALTAAQLKKNGQRSVSLGYDAALFTGPAWHPDWPRVYADQVTPVSALWVNEGRLGGSSGPRVADPARAAAEAFAEALERRGVRVTKIGSARATRQAEPVARVTSLSLERIVEHMLMVSDNDAAEVLARQAAVGAGQPGSFAGAGRVARARLTQLGAWQRGARVRDGSGLSRRNRLPADLITTLLRVSLSPEHPELRGVVTGLPVAAVEGSLRLRFLDRVGRPARGLLRGKTGTLTGVHALAGYVRRPDGALLVYAFLVNDPRDAQAARLWLEHVSAAISSCTCR